MTLCFHCQYGLSPPFVLPVAVHCSLRRVPGEPANGGASGRLRASRLLRPRRRLPACGLLGRRVSAGRQQLCRGERGNVCRWQRQWHVIHHHHSHTRAVLPSPLSGAHRRPVGVALRNIGALLHLPVHGPLRPCARRLLPRLPRLLHGRLSNPGRRLPALGPAPRVACTPVPAAAARRRGSEAGCRPPP